MREGHIVETIALIIHHLGMCIFKQSHKWCHKLIPSNGLTGVLLLAFLLRKMGTSSLLGDTKPDGKRCVNMKTLFSLLEPQGAHYSLICDLHGSKFFAWFVHWKDSALDTKHSIWLETRQIISSPPLLAIRPATENWVESLEAPLPLAFHCSSFFCKIVIRSAKDVFGSMSAEDF